MKKLKVGIIGCGRISRFHGMPAADQENAELLACCDLVIERAEQMAELFGCEGVYQDYEQMIQEEALDLVHICLPHYLHAPVAIRAMQLGCHVLTEKPMAISYEQGVDMVKAAKKHKRKLGVIFQNRYNAGSKLVKNCLDSGQLGEVLAAKCFVTWCRTPEYYQSSDWKGTWDKEGGGAIIDQAIHTIDLMCWLLGYDIAQVDCSLANRDHQGIIEVEDCADGLIVFNNGVRASFWCMNYYSHDAAVEIDLVCENGSAKISAEEGRVLFHDGRELRAKPNPQESFDYGGGPSYWGASHLKQIDEFYAALAEDREPEINGELILDTAHKLIMSLYDAGRNNKRVIY
ncbi:MAG: Gfo/Idh/MocA family oxidoreductase [Lentisphaeria bacterium]|nr:Gfo/Idh/MocA family oxidoreductase [Lentisphaeria bacterium]NLZ60165.1 Gfo/Idh/MocA family oxidoreductase [Lentisphaerota bacterium]